MVDDVYWLNKKEKDAFVACRFAVWPVVNVDYEAKEDQEFLLVVQR